ncbi:MAG: hypothetical protein IJS53_04615 [Clostridia bacterium]|nr:hypothetical protein [Clostridia bacterium]
MTAFYTREEADALSLRARRCRAIALALICAALAICTALCFFVRTGNEGRMFILVVSVFTLLGWIALLLLTLVWRPLRAESRHITGVLAGEQTEYRGVLEAPGAPVKIPGSIAVRKVMLRQGEESVMLNVRARLADRLPPAGTPVRVCAVMRYIVACEVDHE